MHMPILPFVKLSLAQILASRDVLVITCFVFVLLITAMGAAGWLDTVNSLWHCAWISLLPAIYILFFIITSQDAAQRALFQALRCDFLYDVCQAAVSLCMLTTVPLIWAVIALYFGSDLSSAITQIGLMLCFILAALGALFSTRQLIEPHKLPRYLYLLISGPWNLIAWILALSACNAALAGDSGLFQRLALVFFAFWWWIQTALRRNQ